MFLRDLKNIYNCVQTNNLHNAERHAMNMLYMFNNVQYGGNDLENLLKEYINPRLDKFFKQQKTMNDYVLVSLKFIDYIRNFIEKSNIENTEQLKTLLDEIRNILTKHLDK